MHGLGVKAVLGLQHHACRQPLDEHHSSFQPEALDAGEDRLVSELLGCDAAAQSLGRS